MALSDTCLDSIEHIAHSVNVQAMFMTDIDAKLYVDALYSLAALVAAIDATTRQDANLNLCISRIVTHALLDRDDAEAAINLLARLAKSDSRLLASLEMLMSDIEDKKNLLALMKDDIYAQLSSRVISAYRLAKDQSP